MKRIFELFESWIPPFDRRDDLTPPENVWGFIWFYVGQAKWPFLLMMITGAMVGALEAALFWFVGRLIDIFASIPKDAGWSGLIAAHGYELAAMVVVVLVVRFLVTAIGALVEEQAIVVGFFNMVRWQSYLHVSRQPLAFFQNDFSGRIVTKVWAAGQATGDFVTSILQVAWFVVIYTVSTMALVARLDWRLAALVAVWIVAFGALARYFVPRIRIHSRDTAEAGSMLNGRVVDAYSNIQTLKLFGRSEDHDAFILSGFHTFQKTVTRFARFITGVRSSLALLSGIMISTFGALCVDLYLAGHISAGGVAFSLGLVLRLNFLLGRLMTQLNSIMRSLGSIQNSAELISKPIELLDKPDARELIAKEPEVRFENIRFHYGKGGGVIENLSLSIRPGEKVGIVGRSGAGKTTLVNLLLRFYDLEGGRILIGGQDIASVTQESLRSKIGMVTQDTALLHRSIRDNIMIGRWDATEAELIAAAEEAEAYDFIRA